MGRKGRDGVVSVGEGFDEGGREGKHQRGRGSEWEGGGKGVREVTYIKIGIGEAKVTKRMLRERRESGMGDEDIVEGRKRVKSTDRTESVDGTRQREE